MRRTPIGGLVRWSLRIDRLNRGIGRAAAWLLAVMVVVGACNALARSIESHFDVRLSSNAWIELQWYLFGVAFLLGAPWTLRRGEHVRVDVLQAGLPERGRWWTDLVGALVLLVPFCAFAVWASWDFVAESWRSREISSDPGGLPRYPLKAIIPIGFALLGLQGLSEAIKRAALLRGARPAAVGLDDGLEPGTADE